MVYILILILLMFKLNKNLFHKKIAIIYYFKNHKNIFNLGELQTQDNGIELPRVLNPK